MQHMESCMPTRGALRQQLRWAAAAVAAGRAAAHSPASSSASRAASAAVPRVMLGAGRPCEQRTGACEHRPNWAGGLVSATTLPSQPHPPEVQIERVSGAAGAGLLGLQQLGSAGRSPLAALAQAQNAFQWRELLCF